MSYKLGNLVVLFRLGGLPKIAQLTAGCSGQNVNL